MESQNYTVSETLDMIAKQAYLLGVYNKDDECPFSNTELAEYWRDGAEGRPFKFLEFKEEHWTVSGF